MELANAGQVARQRLAEASGERCAAVAAALALADGELSALRVHVLHAQPQALQQAQAAAMEQGGLESVDAAERREHGAHFVAREHHGKWLRAPRTRRLVQPLELAAHSVAAEKDQSGQRLVLRGSRHLRFGREVREELHHL